MAETTYLADARKRVDPSDVHCARSADALPAGPAEGQGGVDLVLDLDERVQDHGPALVEVHVVLLHAGLGAGGVRVPAVDGELLHLGRAHASGRRRRRGSRGVVAGLK